MTCTICDKPIFPNESRIEIASFKGTHIVHLACQYEIDRKTNEIIDEERMQ